MPVKINIELISMSLEQSECTVWHEAAIVFTNDESERRGIPWRSISREEFTLSNAMAVVVLDGYNHVNPAVYCGISGSDAVYAIYKQQED